MARQFKSGQLQTGSLFNISSSYAVTASFALNGGGGNTFPFSGSAVISGSLVVSGSGITGSLSGTASVALTAQTASYVLNAVSSSFAATASYVVLAQTASFVTASNVIGTVTSASFAVSASYILNAKSSSFATTASYVLNAVSSSFATSATLATTASYILNAQTASFVTTAQTASYVLNAVSSSFATIASTASFVTTAQTASYVTQAVSASYATTASYYNETDPIFVAKSASLATTGSNTFKGNQTISGSIYLNSGSVIDSIGADVVIKAGVGNNAGVVLYNNNSTQYLAVDASGSYANKFTVMGLTTTQNQAVSGSITFAGGSKLTNEYDYHSIDIQAGPGGYAELLSNNTQTNIYVTDENANIVTSGVHYWGFDATGSTTMPGRVTATSFTGSLFGTASQAILAQTASYATQAVSASYVNPLTQTVSITGSLIVQNNIDSSIRNLIDTIGTASLNWDSRYLYNGNGSISLDWKDRKLYDSNVANSIHWNTRQLFKSNGTTVTLDWETGALTGSLLGTASYAIQALSASWAPTAATASTFPFTGSAIISGSLTITGSLNVSRGITGSLLGTASWAASATSAPLYLPLTGGTLSGNLSAAGTTFTCQDLTLGSGTTFGTIKTDGTTKYIGIYPNLNFETTRFFDTGHVGFQNGGTYTDTGYRVQISQSNSISGSFLSIGTSNFVGATLMTGSLNVSAGITGSLLGTSSYASQALSASNAATASYYGGNAVSASYASTASYVNPLRQAVFLTGSFELTGSQRTAGYIQFDPVTTNIDTSISSSFIYVSGSTKDLYFSQNSAGYSNSTRLRWLESTLYTGILYGGVITSTPGTTTFTITAGEGLIVTQNAFTGSAPYPTTKLIAWPTTTQSILNSGSAKITYVGIDSNGAVVQQIVPWGSTDINQFDTQIGLGVVLHLSGSVSTGVFNSQQISYGPSQKQDDFFRAFGPLKISGHTLQTSGSTLGLTKAGGIGYREGANYVINPNHPSTVVENAITTSKIYRYYISGSTPIIDTGVANAGYAVIDPAQRVNLATGLLTSVSTNKYSLQRVFWVPNSPTNAFIVYYGNAQYDSLIDAVNAKDNEPFTEAPNTAANAIYLGCIAVAGGATNLANASDATIIQGGIFRSVGGVGSSGTSPLSTTFSGLSDVSVASRVANDLLIYNGSQWQNSKTLTGNYSINGDLTVTGSVIGTASVATTATTASYVLQAVSSSYATQALSASYAPGGGNPFPLTGTAEITGSLLVTGSVQTTGIFEVYDANNVSTALFNSRELKDSLFNNTSINWNARWLYDNFGNTSLGWGILRTAFDANTSSSIEWGTRALKNSAGNTILNWETGTFTGTASYAPNTGVTKIIAGSNISISPTLGIGDVTINASAASPFPYTGSAIISGSLEITGSLRGQVSTLSISVNTASVNMSSNNFFTLSLVNGASTNINPTNINPGQTVNILVTQGTAGTGTVTFPSLVKQTSGSLYTGSAVANAIDIVTMIAFDSTNVYVSSVRNMI